MSNIWAALIGASSALLVAFVTELAIGRRERAARAFDRRSAALMAAQDAALELRSALNEYGPLVRRLRGAADGAELAGARRRVDDATARLGVTLSRIDDPAVAAAITAWRDRARFHYVSTEEVTTAEEARSWEAINSAVGSALRPAAPPR